MNKIERAAKYYVQEEVKGMIDHDIDTGDMERAFIAGVEWAEKNKVKSKPMCLKDKTKGEFDAIAAFVGSDIN